VGKDSCMTWHIWSAGINRWLGVLEEWMQFFKVGGYGGGDQLVGWRTDRVLGESEGGDETGEQ
jgi:hypothetical protein